MSPEESTLARADQPASGVAESPPNLGCADPPTELGYRTISRNLSSNLGYQALLVGVNLQDEGSKIQVLQKVLWKNL